VENDFRCNAVWPFEKVGFKAGHEAIQLFQKAMWHPLFANHSLFCAASFIFAPLTHS
jgi:hypothetical protein